jgi:hypothetical protein
MTRTYYRWDETVAKLRRNPGKWVRTHDDVPFKSSLRIVRLKKHPALVIRDGVIEAEMDNQYLDENGLVRGILWMRYTPHENL